MSKLPLAFWRLRCFLIQPAPNPLGSRRVRGIYGYAGLPKAHGSSEAEEVILATQDCTLYSINSLAREFGLDRKRVTSLLQEVPADGQVQDHDGWYLLSVVEILARAMLDQ